MNVPIATTITLVVLGISGALYVENKKADRVEVASALNEQTYIRYEEAIQEAQTEKREAKKKQDTERVEQLEERIQKYEKRQQRIK
jgi:hypothetical protein